MKDDSKRTGMKDDDHSLEMTRCIHETDKKHKVLWEDLIVEASYEHCSRLKASVRNLPPPREREREK